MIVLIVFTYRLLLVCQRLCQWSCVLHHTVTILTVVGSPYFIIMWGYTLQEASYIYQLNSYCNNNI